MRNLILFFILAATATSSEINLPNVAGIERRDLPSWVTSGPPPPSETAARQKFCFDKETDPYDCLKNTPEFQLCQDRYKGWEGDASLLRLYCWCDKYNGYKHRCNYCLGKEGVERSIRSDELACEGYQTDLISKGLLVGPTTGSDKNPSKTTATATTTDDTDSKTWQTPSLTFIEPSKTSGNWFEDSETETPTPGPTAPTASELESIRSDSPKPEGSDSTMIRPVMLTVGLISSAIAVFFV